MAITNKEINLSQLDQELGGFGLIADLNDPKKKIILPADNSTVTESELAAAIAIHNAIDEAAAAATQKAALLARLGITADEAKLLIG